MAPATVPRSDRLPVDALPLLAGMVLLTAPLSHLVLGGRADGWALARLIGEVVAGVALLVPALAGWVRPAAALLFAAFAVVNVLAVLAGRSDCGCFAFPVHPLVTGGLDVVLAAALWRGHAPALVAAATAALVVVVALVPGPSSGMSARGLIGQRIAAFDEGSDTLIAVTRSDCADCTRVLPLMLLTHGAAVRMPPMQVLDLSAGAAPAEIAYLTRPADAECARILRGAPAPCVVRIRAGVIEEVEAWPVARAQ